MKTTYWSRFALFCFLGLVLNFFTQAQTEKGTLWKVTGKGLPEPSYLFGTYHLLTDTYIKELPEVQKAFNDTHGIVVETIIDSSKLNLMTKMSLMPDKKISEMIAPDDFTLISNELQKTMGVNLSALDQLKPVSIMVLLTVLHAQQQNADVLKKYRGIAMDAYFAIQGKRNQKTITPLETMEEQLAILYNHFPVDEQARQLVSYIKQLDTMKSAQVKLLNHYLAKNLGQLYQYAESMPKDFGDSDFMLKNRNEKWMQTLPGLMKKETQFIAVGALHLPGPCGVIELLRKQGYTVTPVNN